jgi:hypothetical protein
LVRTENGKEFRRNRRHLLCRFPVMPGTHGPAKTCAESARGQQAAPTQNQNVTATPPEPPAQAPSDGSAQQPPARRTR